MSELAADTNLINIDKVCAMLMLDEESVRSLFKKFADLLPDMVSELRAAVESKDLALTCRLGHKLKGTVGNFRIQEMQSICSKINKLGSCGEEASLLICELEECSGKVIAQINAIC